MTTSTAAQCPICARQLMPSRHESVDVLSCTHGVFLQPDDLRAALHDRTHDRPETEEREAVRTQGEVSAEALMAEGDRACPVCREPMAKTIYAAQSGVSMDSCIEHGIWLDDGELQRIEAWYEAQEGLVVADRATWVDKLNEIERQHDIRAEQEVAGLYKFDLHGGFGDRGGRDGTDWWNNGKGF